MVEHLQINIKFILRVQNNILKIMTMSKKILKSLYSILTALSSVHIFLQWVFPNKGRHYNTTIQIYIKQNYNYRTRNKSKLLDYHSWIISNVWELGKIDSLPQVPPLAAKRH